VSRRVLILVVGVTLAAVSAFSAYSYASSADKRAFGDAKLVQIFIVKKDIGKGLPGERALDEGYITKERIPAKFYPARAVVNIQALRGKVAVAPLAAGVPVVDGSFVEPRVASESFAQRLDKGMQAVTISVSDVQGVARLVVPGDHVNMLVTIEEAAGDTTDGADGAAGAGQKTTRFALQNIEVLAIGNSTQLQPGEQAPATETAAGQVQTVDSGLITFAVPALDAERVVHASETGAIHLTLVPPDYTPVPVPPVNRGNLFS
jgi:pilus assembly protein CpaB